MSTNISSKERIFLLDNIKGVLIFLVVFGHSLELYKDTHLGIRMLYTFIYLFHMPAFVFISGYFSKDVEKCRETAFTNFLIPFLIFNTLWNVIVVIGTQNLDAFSFITPGWALWYLLSMFFWRLFLKDLIKIRFILPISFIIGLGAGLFGEFDSLLSLSRTLVFLPFFIIGYKVSEKELFQLKQPSRFYSLFILFITLLFTFFISYYDVLPIEFLYGSASFGSYTIPIWLGLIGRILLYIVGLSFIFALPNSITPKVTFFSYIGQNSFSIYVLHTYLLGTIFALNFYISSTLLKIMICVLGSIGITWLLSREFIYLRVNKIILIFNRVITKQYKT